jgi:cytochrome c553
VEHQSSWERRLWKGRRYVLTDFRLVATDLGDEISLDDIGDIHRSQSFVQTLVGLSTLDVRHRDSRRRGVVLRSVRRGAQLAALIELLATDRPARADTDAASAARATMTWEPRIRTAGAREALTAMAVMLVALVAIAVGLHGKSRAIAYPEDDAIYPKGAKRERREIVRFMERTVMPWARVVLAPIAGSSARVTCGTCHGAQPELSEWRMPAVATLPRPAIREAGWEHYGGVMDSQMRNAIYGYGSTPDNVARAAYMREVVMPGMAALLHRPAYDFTRTYDYNREQFAFGCYHCHKVK